MFFHSLLLSFLGWLPVAMFISDFKPPWNARSVRHVVSNDALTIVDKRPFLIDMRPARERDMRF
jgi:hypothetical protein